MIRKATVQMLRGAEGSRGGTGACASMLGAARHGWHARLPLCCSKEGTMAEQSPYSAQHSNERLLDRESTQGGLGGPAHLRATEETLSIWPVRM